MTVGLALTALGLGLRHGIDWDHIAAIADLTGSASDRRRGFVLSLWYAVGHAAVVLVLGGALIMVGATIPESLDTWMGRVVGLTLVLLGVVLLIDLVRQGPSVRLRSRWMLVIDGTFAGLRRVRAWRGRRTISVTHEHVHEHDGALDHERPAAHDHAHDRAGESAGVAAVSDVPVTVPPAPRPVLRLGRAHRHQHRHDLDLPVQADTMTGSGVAAGVGVLHGIGIESPTQIAIFVGSASIAGKSAGMLLLVLWVAGLVVANGALALAAGRGLVHPDRHRRLYQILAGVVAAASIALGLVYLTG